MNYDEKKNIFKFLNGESILEIMDNTKKEIESEHNKISNEIFNMIKKYPEISQFKSLYDRYLYLENKLKEYDLTPKFFIK